MKAEITVGAIARGGSVVVDGVDISKFTRALCLTADIDEVTRLELELIATQGATVVADAVVELHPDMAAFLIHLGWTPPDPAPPSGAEALAEPSG